jgi:hypothetical protein
MDGVDRATTMRHQVALAAVDRSTEIVSDSGCGGFESSKIYSVVQMEADYPAVPKRVEAGDATSRVRRLPFSTGPLDAEEGFPCGIRPKASKKIVTQEIWQVLRWPFIH